MDLWIRSQDKELLVNTKGFGLQQHYKDSPCQIFGVWNNNYKCVGTYKTKERALEVLDEIQEYMQIDKDHYEGANKVAYQECAVYKNDYLMIYEMPKE